MSERGMIGRVARSWVVALVAILALVSLTACGAEEKTATNPPGVPAIVDPGDANLLEGGVQELRVTITNGQFGNDIYNMQPGALQMIVNSSGGPYQLSIEKHVADQQLPAEGQTKVGFTAPEAGEYVMSVTGNYTGTALLNVRPPGGE
jgi:hypothetical protein